MNADRFVRYQPSVETPAEDEQAHLEQIVATMRSISERLGDRYRHAVRSVHSKSHGVLHGTLEVLAGLDPAYAQGLFAHPGRYDVVARLSTNPGDVLPDDVSTPRGFAIKVLGPEGEAMVEGHEGERTQDFLFINAPVLGAPTPKEFAGQMKMFERHLDDPVAVKQAVSAASRTAEKALAAIGKPNPLLASLGGAPPTHMLGETYNTQLAARHGDYVAKYALTPTSGNLLALKDRELDVRDPDHVRNSIVEFFATESGVWDVGVQLCANLETMPVEDGATPWSEDESPFATAARLTFAAQPAYTPERRVYADEVLSMSPWHAFAAHRPLGAHNRVRRAAYAMSSGYRHAENARSEREPRDASEFFALDTQPPKE